MSVRTILCSLNFGILLLLSPCNSYAQNATDVVPQTWQMLDYLATDYAGAVQQGKVISTSEYAEQREFSATIRQHLATLPHTSQQPALLTQADALITLINDKAADDQVAQQAHQLADALLAAYPMPTAPTQVPDISRGKQLYAEQCAACHGAKGDGKGAAAPTLDPPPIAFTNVARADQRSPLSLYQTITQGSAGTAMASYRQLSDADRWALAYYVGDFAYASDSIAGAQLWHDDPTMRASISNLNELSHTRADQLIARFGAHKTHALLGYLRAHPNTLDHALTGISLARARLAASLQAYLSGDHQDAIQLALSAYLDGVEPVEPLLNTHDSALRAQIEIAMGAYRSNLTHQVSPDNIRQQAQQIDRMLSEAQTLTGDAASSPTTTFIGAFTILVREGLEALLVVVALIAFLNKAGRRETLPYVHAGWLLALLAGGMTWFVARYFIDISGASRELTEGLSSLFAVAVLLGVGLWMHQKSMGNRWQAYIKDKMNNALSQQSAWLLFVLTFVTVYREIFETILFYVALWQDGQGGWMLGGIACAVATLALITWILLGTSKRLPISTFFSASSALIALLAFVMAGKGIAALQEAGWVGVTLAPVPHIELLGIYPTWQTSLMQAAILVLLLIGYGYNKYQAAHNN